jgi:hypothetical protein
MGVRSRSLLLMKKALSLFKANERIDFIFWVGLSVAALSYTKLCICFVLNQSFYSLSLTMTDKQLLSDANLSDLSDGGCCCKQEVVETLPWA